MIKRLTLLLVMFTCIAANAQSVTEKDLLGTWKLEKVFIEGIVMDFKTGKASIEEGYEYDYTPEDVKYYEDAMKGHHPFPLSFTFLKKNRIEITMADGVHLVEEYKVESDITFNYISFEGKSFEVKIANGVFTIFTEMDGNEIIMDYIKK